MHGEYFDDIVPTTLGTENLPLETRRDVLYLGKDNLRFLLNFWRRRVKNLSKRLEIETDYCRRNRLEEGYEDAKRKIELLNKLLTEAGESKPILFSKPAFSTGSRITVFLENPDRFVSGVITKIKTDTDGPEDDLTITNGVFYIRPLWNPDHHHIFEYTPKSFTIFHTPDFEYFQDHPRYFRLYLDYHTQSIADRDKAGRMLFAIKGSPTPPDAA